MLSFLRLLLYRGLYTIIDSNKLYLGQHLAFLMSFMGFCVQCHMLNLITQGLEESI